MKTQLASKNWAKLIKQKELSPNWMFKLLGWDSNE